MQPGTFVQSVCPVPMLMETFYTIILRRKQQGPFRRRVFSGKVKGIKLTRKIQFSQKILPLFKFSLGSALQTN